jgi:hypothetical protein
VLAGRLLPRRPATMALLPALAAVGVCYVGVLGYYSTRPALPPATQAVAGWLGANHLTRGIGDYWAANITTVATSDRVQVRGVRVSCGRFAPYVWESMVRAAEHRHVPGARADRRRRGERHGRRGRRPIRRPAAHGQDR